MKKVIFVLIISLFLLFGCTATESTTNNSDIQNSNVATSNTTYSDAVKKLGEITYEEVEIESGYKILPFPGLTYSGFRDNYQAFYASNSDNTFAIYASPSIENTTSSFEEVKEGFILKHQNAYATNIRCENISTNAWLTKKQAFICNYYYPSIDADYKSVIFYDDDQYVEVLIGVWGTDLGDYEYIFDEFSQKAVSWK